MEIEEESVDWGTLKATRRDSKMEEDTGLDVSLKPVPVQEEPVVEKEVKTREELPVSS